jgi:hypothetical protein
MILRFTINFPSTIFLITTNITTVNISLLGVTSQTFVRPVSSAIDLEREGKTSYPIPNAYL